MEKSFKLPLVERTTFLAFLSNSWILVCLFPPALEQPESRKTGLNDMYELLPIATLARPAASGRVRPSSECMAGDPQSR